MATATGDQEPDRKTEPEGPEAAKRPYRSPQLVEYGTVAKLTNAGGASSVDGPVGFMMGPMGMGMGM